MPTFLAGKMAWCLFAVLPFIFMLYGILSGDAEANPIEFLLLQNGEFALYFFLINLYITPFIALTPNSWNLAFLNQRRGFIGVTAFFYALLHVIIFLSDKAGWLDIWENVTKPFILIGLTAFVILSILTMTSHRFFKRYLGRTNWKKLHFLSYLLIPLLILHLISKDKGEYIRAILYFVPYLSLRFLSWYINNKKLLNNFENS